MWGRLAWKFALLAGKVRECNPKMPVTRLFRSEPTLHSTLWTAFSLFLREGDVDRDHYNGQDYRQDQQFPQDLTLLLRLNRVAFLQGVEPCVEAAGGQELIVASCFCDVTVVDHEDLVHVPHQP